ncbi:MAG: HD domain-containing protein [Patescibacteria group bacterium]|nr:HD domain-containing protein [Patescibacteria group bacterium]MDD5715177.1 HD domain-containing protein [Patescibacteria group bacterium]
MTTKDILNFFFELGQLKKVEHEGWRLAGVEHPEKVTDHSLRVAHIAYALAHLEQYPNPEEVCTMAVFHDIAECRTGDVHNVAKHYVKRDEARAVRAQLKNLGTLGKKIYLLWKQVEDRKTKAGIIAKDADYLEQAVTAKEYLERGIDLATVWIENVERRLKTKSARTLLDGLRTTRSTDWCKKQIMVS